MLDPDDQTLASAVDEILDRRWQPELRRARRRRAGDSAVRVAVLLIAVIVVAGVIGTPVVLPALLFFGLLGVVCVIAPDAKAPPPGDAGGRYHRPGG